MDLASITPLILTYNEAANIGRCLTGLSWAQRVVVVDSGSEDSTAAIIASDFSSQAKSVPCDRSCGTMIGRNFGTG